MRPKRLRMCDINNMNTTETEMIIEKKDDQENRGKREKQVSCKMCLNFEQKKLE